MRQAKLRQSAARRSATRRVTVPHAQGVERLSCASGLFETAEPEIMRLTAEIGQAPGLREKAGFAGQMIAAAGNLLECREYCEDNTNCVLCRKLAALRHETAALVLKLAGAPRAA
jgi:hypothetical protein